MGDGETREIVREEMCRAPTQQRQWSVTHGLSSPGVKVIINYSLGCNKYPISIICAIVSQICCRLVMIFKPIVVFLQPSDTVSLFLFVCFYAMLNTSYYPICLSRFCSFQSSLSAAIGFPSLWANIWLYSHRNSKLCQSCNEILRLCVFGSTENVSDPGRQRSNTSCSSSSS